VVTHVASVVVAHTLSIKSLEFAASVSVKWRTAVSFPASQRHLGKNDGAIIFSEGILVRKLQTKKVQTNRLDTNSRKATGHV
jgi:hypothetical protein